MYRYALALAVLLIPASAMAELSRWRIDSARSEAYFQVTLRVPIKAEGRFKTIEGDVNALPDMKRNVRVHLNSRELSMGGPTWVQSATESEPFLDTRHYLNIIFESADFSEQVMTSGGEIKGILTIKNTSRPVVFIVAPAACRRPGFSCPINVSGTLNRRDFNMNAYRWSLKDEIRFQFQLKFIE